MQSKTNTIRVEPSEHTQPVPIQKFAPPLRLVNSRLRRRYDIEPYRPVSRLSRSVVIVLAIATSFATLSGALALMVL